MAYNLRPRKKNKVDGLRPKPDAETKSSPSHPLPMFPPTPLNGPIQTPLIARLPTELLTTIFSLVGPFEKSEPYTCHIRNAETWMGWVPLMLVCRHWRNVGIATPWLWRRISITCNLEALQYRLSRTVDCTIDLFLSRLREENEKAMPLLLPFARSIRSIHIPEYTRSRRRRVRFKTDDLPCLKPLFEVPLPVLEHIDFSKLQRPYDGPLEAPFDLGLSEKLHPGILRFVVPSYIKMPSTPSFWSALRELDVRFEMSEDRRTRLDDFLQVVAGAPYLESLVVLGTLLSLTLSEKDTSPSTVGVPTSLHQQNRLRTIHLDGELTFIAPILQRIDAPALSVLHISASIPPNVDIAESAALLFPPPLRRVLSKCKALYVSRNHSWDFQICSAAVFKPDYIRNQEDAMRVPLYFRVTRYQLSSQLSTAIGVLCDGFCTAPLRTLSFEGFYDAAPVAAWRLLQAAFPDIRKTEGLWVIYHFFLALRELALKGGWPLLSRLEVDFGFQSNYNSLGWHFVLQPLLEAARAWHEQKLRLDEIILQRLHITRWQFGPHRWALLTIAALCDRFILRNFLVDGRLFYDAFHPVWRLLKNAKYQVSTGQQTENTEDPKQDVMDGTEAGSLGVELPEIGGVRQLREKVLTQLLQWFCEYGTPEHGLLSPN
ncbi:hypothetical protein BD310DRAFT_952931 [Dichomitus squalens]|uniref:F-box domain-containing protein n=1 Tax=Dichomitus squalens TaxID=114155 RepID=A0A4Q9PG40_9APHY|nr:hypothetical protein BD310DRAFT_952931 [Dichomitus squalens]